jgi:hypothetical protein
MLDKESLRALDVPEQQPDPGAVPRSAQPRAARESDPGEALILLIVGALLEGTDVARQRLQRWDAMAHALAEGMIGDEANDGLSAHPLRYTLLGALLDAEANVRYRAASLRRRGTRAVRWWAGMLQPMASHLPLEWQLQWDTLVERTQLLTDSWLLEGYDAERHGRTLARYALHASMEEVLESLARNPQVRELIEQQSAGVAGEAIDEVRTRAASADAWVEQFTRALLRRDAPLRTQK